MKTLFQMKLKKKTKLSSFVFEFWFERQENFHFIPGQFCEVELPHKNPDSRGMKRYFTIASSPTEKDVLIATKIIPNESSFKKTLNQLKVGKEMYFSKSSGNFILPLKKDPT